MKKHNVQLGFPTGVLNTQIQRFPLPGRTSSSLLYYKNGGFGLKFQYEAGIRSVSSIACI
jgi:hypothetical protein